MIFHYDNPKKRKSWRPPSHASTSTAEYSWKKTHVVYLVESAWIASKVEVFRRGIHMLPERWESG